MRTRLKNDGSHPLRWLSAFRDRKEGTSLLSAGWLGALGHAAKPSSPDLHGSAWSSRVVGIVVTNEDEPPVEDVAEGASSAEL
jgi:hypothetical protein